ncbi:hypothetical protein GCM10007103_27640 [Salinimicrobium marinum]|uniref:Thiamine-binding protein domain-containing protein n=2 Tax=Salinimicrobium marinum TaxID=680283 RepID=A0A918W0G5_9FLAO|nr:hypothetical protein GCM10007103_27640 [Salinimicrobium marinum]
MKKNEMQISVELTLSPLQDDFKAPIQKFIKALRKSGFRVIENPLSTQVYGEYDKIMEFLTEEIKEAFASSEHVLLTMKIVKSNLSDYAADF